MKNTSRTLGRSHCGDRPNAKWGRPDCGIAGPTLFPSGERSAARHLWEFYRGDVRRQTVERIVDTAEHFSLASGSAVGVLPSPAVGYRPFLGLATR
jgi:hypothetical protein